MSTHTGEKPYHCSQCDKFSSKKESWDTHIEKNVSIQGNWKLFLSL